MYFRRTGPTLAGEVAVRALDCVDVTTGVLTEKTLVGETFVAEATGVGGVRGCLPVEVVLQLGVVRKETATSWTGNQPLGRVDTGVV